MLKVINANMHWAEIETNHSNTVLILGGITPGGKSIKLRVTLDSSMSLGYLGAELHKALRKREEEMKQTRLQLEGRIA